jgi:Effector Associated Constant Component 1
VELNQSVKFEAHDINDLYALYRELRGTPAVAVEPVAAPNAPGEQGAMLDFLMVACASGGAITTVLQIVRTMIESRGPTFKLAIRSGKDRIEINADNIEDVLPIVRELLGGS